VDNFRGKKGVKLLDYQWDEDHNRSVVTVVGEPNALKEAVINAVGTAQELIDMTSHEGQHPRMGATDVVPFIPVKNATVEECIELSKEVGKELWEKYQIPVFLYEKSASGTHRRNL
jgi:glutamate formiminotransferase